MAWIAETQTRDGYGPGLSCFAGAAETFHSAHPRVPNWVSRLCSRRPTDGNGDVRGNALVRLAGVDPKTWDFVNDALAWRYIIDWDNPRQPTAPHGEMRLFDDTAVRRSWNSGDVDLNVARMREPSRPFVRGPQVRRLVGRVEFERAAVQGGQETRVNVVLDIVAPHAIGTVVLVSRNRLETTVTAWMRVPAGAKAVALTVPNVAVERTTAVRIKGRAVQ